MISARDGYEISTDPARLDLDAIHAFLVEAYWSPGIPRTTMERAFENSLVFGLYAPDGAQAGFARVVTDKAVHAHLADVFVLPEHRSRGLGVWLVDVVLAHPDLEGVRRFSLGTWDAHELYARFGFRPLEDPSIHMAIERDPKELWRE